MESGSDQKPPAWPERSASARKPDQAATLARVERLARSARFAWLGLIGYLAFVGLTLLSVRDVDFFSVSAQTTLPIVGIAIPTLTFFWTAPLLGAVLHGYLHLHLVKLWDALAAAPARIEGIPLGDHVAPWLVIDWALHQRGDGAVTPRPLDRIGSVVTALLVWWAAPLVLVAFWWRSMPAHEEWMTLAIAAAVSVSVYATIRSRRHARRSPAPKGGRRQALRALVTGMVIFLAVVSWLRTEGGIDHYVRTIAGLIYSSDVLYPFEDEFWCPAKMILASQSSPGREFIHYRQVLAREVCSWADTLEVNSDWLSPIHLPAVELVARPADWQDHDVAERRFRVGWCRDKEMPPDLCNRIATPYHATDSYHMDARTEWCGHRVTESDCLARFGQLEQEFSAEWKKRRAGYFASLGQSNFSGLDLRHAQARGAFLANANPSYSRRGWSGSDGCGLSD